MVRTERRRSSRYTLGVYLLYSETNDDQNIALTPRQKVTGYMSSHPIGNVTREAEWGDFDDFNLQR